MRAHAAGRRAVPASRWVALMERLSPRGANPRTRRLVACSLIGASALIVAVTLFLQATDALNRLELSTVNQRFERARQPGPPPDDQVLVAIDDFTFTLRRSRTWPFDRSDHAHVIHNLREGRGEGDRLRRAVHRGERQTRRPTLALDGRRQDGAGNIVLATTEVRSDGSTRSSAAATRSAQTAGPPTPASRPTPTARSGACCATRTGCVVRHRPPRAGQRARRSRRRRASRTGSTSPARRARVRTISFVNVSDGRSTRTAVRGKIVTVGSTADVAAGLPPHLDQRRHADGRRRDPLGRDPHGAGRLPAALAAPGG